MNINFSFRTAFLAVLVVPLRVLSAGNESLTVNGVVGTTESNIPPNVRLQLGGSTGSDVCCMLHKFKNKEGKDQVVALALSQRGNELWAGRIKIGSINPKLKNVTVYDSVKIHSQEEKLADGNVFRSLWLDSSTVEAGQLRDNESKPRKPCPPGHTGLECTIPLDGIKKVTGQEN